MLKGFKNFVMRGDIVTVAVGLIIALALSTLIKAFTDFVINPVIARLQGGHGLGLGWQLGRAGNRATYLDVGSFLSAVIYFIIFMAVVYFFIVVPYKHVQARRGVVVFEEPGRLKTCLACLSEDLPAAAGKCRYCGTDQPSGTARPA
ncbi:large conductance mechanosensitive channel protein MscL [Streptomyces sp. L500]